MSDGEADDVEVEDGTAGDATVDDGDGNRRTWVIGGLVFVLACVATFATQYLSGAYASPDRILGLAAGSALVGLASALPVVVALPLASVRELFRQHRRPVRVAMAVLLAVTVAAVAVPTLGPQVLRLTNEWWGCEPSAEFTVVTTPAVRNTADELVDAFERSTGAANDGCPTVHGFVYDVPEDTITHTVALHWKTTQGSTELPRRDVGPRPDIWLTESTLPVSRVYETSPTTQGDARPFGLSPVVLAVPGDPPKGSPRLPQLFADRSTSTGVVRPDPDLSTAGLLATAALYGIDADRSPAQTAPPATDGADIEQRLDAAALAGGFPKGDEGALLCRYGELRDGPRPALLLSEQAAVRYTTGQLVGGPCPGSPRDPLPLFPVYVSGPTLIHQVVRFTWPEGPAAPPAAAAFEQWLTAPEGQRAVAGTRLRPLTAGDGSTAEDEARGQLDPERVESVRLAHAAAARPRRDLLALDFSGSMNRAGRGADGTRADVVKDAVRRTCPTGADDEIGLWSFPDDTDRGPLHVVEFTPDGCAAVLSGLAPLVPKGDTPLLQTIADGIETLRSTDDTRERRLVVVTDGEDTSSGATPTQVLDAATDADVKVYVVTLGDVSCDTVPLREIARLSGGRCFDPGDTAGQILYALGGIAR